MEGIAALQLRQQVGRDRWVANTGPQPLAATLLPRQVAALKAGTAVVLLTVADYQAVSQVLGVTCAQALSLKVLYPSCERGLLPPVPGIAVRPAPSVRIGRGSRRWLRGWVVGCAHLQPADEVISVCADHLTKLWCDAASGRDLQAVVGCQPQHQAGRVKKVGGVLSGGGHQNTSASSASDGCSEMPISGARCSRCSRCSTF